MKYNGKELVEMLPENWDGKTREMLVWRDYDAKPRLALVCGFSLKGHPIADIGNYKKEKTYSNHVVFQYCAEIPKEEPDYSIDDLIKLITKRCEATSWVPADRCIVECLKSIKEIIEENEKLKTNVNELKNSCSYRLFTAMCNEKAKLEEKIENLKKEQKLNKEEQIKWLNNEIVNLQYELSQPCINYDYKAKQLAMYKSFWELIYETK